MLDETDGTFNVVIIIPMCCAVLCVCAERLRIHIPFHNSFRNALAVINAAFALSSDFSSGFCRKRFVPSSLSVQCITRCK